MTDGRVVTTRWSRAVAGIGFIFVGIGLGAASAVDVPDGYRLWFGAAGLALVLAAAWLNPDEKTIGLDVGALARSISAIRPQRGDIVVVEFDAGTDLPQDFAIQMKEAMRQTLPEGVQCLVIDGATLRLEKAVAS